MNRVLVVENDRSTRLQIAIALRRDGLDVECVARAEEASVIALDGGFDVIVADADGDGDGMDGRALLLSLKEQCPEAEVVLTSARPSVEGAVDAMKLGARDYLRKPFEAPELVRVVRAALEKHAATPVALPISGRRDAATRAAFSRIIGNSPTIRSLLEIVATVAETDSTVLVTGETGTGKELIGRAIHEASRRRDRVFCALNSAAFPESLLESELFGHRRGAFTGAATTKKGLFEHAHQGTVFLDEVAEMPLSMQAKLLRFLQTGEVRPVGGEETRVVDVRVVTATNKDLEAEVAAGRFREDLYYRLAVIPIVVPPLRERPEDIAILASHFLRRCSAKLGKSVDRIEPDAMLLLGGYAWRGNVRELENTIERGVALCRSRSIGVADLPERLRKRQPVATAPTEALQSLDIMERRHILETLDRVGWNRKRAAEALRISTTTLWRRLKEFGIEADPSRPHAEAVGVVARRF